MNEETIKQTVSEVPAKLVEKEDKIVSEDQNTVEENMTTSELKSNNENEKELNKPSAATDTNKSITKDLDQKQENTIIETLKTPEEPKSAEATSNADNVETSELLDQAGSEDFKDKSELLADQAGSEALKETDVDLKDNETSQGHSNRENNKNELNNEKQSKLESKEASEILKDSDINTENDNILGKSLESNEIITRNCADSTTADEVIDSSRENETETNEIKQSESSDSPLTDEKLSSSTKDGDRVEAEKDTESNSLDSSISAEASADFVDTKTTDDEKDESSRTSDKLISKCASEDDDAKIAKDVETIEADSPNSKSDSATSEKLIDKCVSEDEAKIDKDVETIKADSSNSKSVSATLDKEDEDKIDKGVKTFKADSPNSKSDSALLEKEDDAKIVKDVESKKSVSPNSKSSKATEASNKQTIADEDNSSNKDIRDSLDDEPELKLTLNDSASELDEDENEVGEVEEVEIPEEKEVEEMIVPDGDEVESSNGDNFMVDDEDDELHSKPTNDEENTKDTDVEAVEELSAKLLKSSEDETSHSALEPELVAIEEASKDMNSLDDKSNDNDDEEENSNNAIDDPLNYVESPEQLEGDDANELEICGESNKEDLDEENKSEANKEDDEEDDDVQFVETRNSPICIESDEDESSMNSSSIRIESRANDNTQTINLPTATITLSKNVTITRTCARKSTSRPQNVTSSPAITVPAHHQHRSKDFSYLNKATSSRRSMPAAIPPSASLASTSSRKVVDTIELLDSSDEETTHTRRHHQHNLRTPPKRTLMAAKSLSHKSPNKFNNAVRVAMPQNFYPSFKRQAKKPAPPPLPPATPQSNFLNAVHLQPAAITGANPPAFSALLSNKSVIIPNAFYGNPPASRGGSTEAEKERSYARWLDSFITQFSNPQLVASHSCFVFLQRALKYKDFVRIKNVRTTLNSRAQTAREQVNPQLMLDLRSIFFKNSKEITAHGKRFCELTCSMAQSKSVTLLVHGVTSRVIMKTCNMEMSATSSNTSSTSSPSTSANTNRKRQLEEDEYVPDKTKLKGGSSGRANAEDDKRSLRSKRAKRLDNSFSYNEDDLAEYDIEDEEEEAERLAQEAIQRKIEKKRMEAQKQRQQQVKSFESAFLQTFAKSVDGPTSLPKPNKASLLRSRLNNSTASSASATSSSSHHMFHNDAEDLLQATWIENVENDDTQVISDDDEEEQQQEEPKEQRVFRQQQLKRHQQLQRSSKQSVKPVERDPYKSVDPRQWPKNTDKRMHVNCQAKDVCVICDLSIQRIVHHYINEHRGSEVYNSRLSTDQLEQLKQGACNILNVSLYKNGQSQYEAYCVFCQKQSRFMFPYWLQHFTMHTGEYAYRCSECGIRKPTRSLLTQHQAQGCGKEAAVLQDYVHDTKKLRIEARICTLCNYVQLHRQNIVKHLHHQHNIKQILPKHIQTITLLKTESAVGPSMPTPEVLTRSSRRSAPATYSSTGSNVSYTIQDIDDDDGDNSNDIDNDDNTLLFGEDTLPPMTAQPAATNEQNNYYNYMPPYMMNNNHNNFTWEEVNDPGEDLSYMICGMLDVQMNNE